MAHRSPRRPATGPAVVAGPVPRPVLWTESPFGDTRVAVLRGDMLEHGVAVDAGASSDDTYLTMSGGVARVLAEGAGAGYRDQALRRTPLSPGSIVVTGGHGLRIAGRRVRHVLPRRGAGPGRAGAAGRDRAGGEGSLAYVGTMWPVDEQVAQRLVRRFYTGLLDGQASLGECLRQAKAVAADDPTRVGQAAFILYGDPDTRPGSLLDAGTA
jgi:hypothetical protein